MPIAFIDAHVHANNRSFEDFARLKAIGCAGVVAVAGSEGGFSGPGSVLDFFRRLHLVDRPRVERVGMRFHLALGIHPAAVPQRGLGELLAVLPGALESFRAEALGEIGLERGGAEEEDALAQQLGIAARAGLPVIVHTPRRNKRSALERILEIVAASPLEPARILLDHLDEEVLAPALGSGCCLGLSVHPAKLSPERAAAIVEEHGPGRLLLSTDMGANPSYLFGIPATVSAMRDRGLDQEVIRAVVFANASAFLRLEP